MNFVALPVLSTNQMKQFNLIVNPIFLLLLIISFVYVYFFYLADGPARRNEAAEAEMEMARPVTPATNPSASATVAGVIMREENPFNMGNEPGQMNVLNGEQFFNQQNRQDTRKTRNVVAVAGGALGKTWIEAHWIGLEAGPLVPAVAKANKIPPDVTGVMVDEVTLAAAESGLLAGDVMTEVNGVHLNDLRSFKHATNLVAHLTQTQVTVYRRGAYKNILVSSPDAFGTAQIEGAPMILATDRAPHGYYGPCDTCHSIAPGKTNLNQMAKDLGDILTTSAPNIRKGTPAPHGNRGACSQCHVLL